MILVIYRKLGEMWEQWVVQFVEYLLLEDIHLKKQQLIM